MKASLSACYLCSKKLEKRVKLLPGWINKGYHISQWQTIKVKKPQDAIQWQFVE